MRLAHHNNTSHNFMNNATRRTPPPLTSYAIADTGTTGHYLKPASMHDNRQPDANPITICMPNGDGIRSSHSCTLALPTLPPDTTKGHILPGLASHSLLSVAKFCDNDCDIHFSRDHCTILRHN
jgi:hypothetical protein